MADWFQRKRCSGQLRALSDMYNIYHALLINLSETCLCRAKAAVTLTRYKITHAYPKYYAYIVSLLRNATHPVIIRHPRVQWSDARFTTVPPCIITRNDSETIIVTWCTRMLYVCIRIENAQSFLPRWCNLTHRLDRSWHAEPNNSLRATS